MESTAWPWHGKIINHKMTHGTRPQIKKVDSYSLLAMDVVTRRTRPTWTTGPTFVPCRRWESPISWQPRPVDRSRKRRNPDILSSLTPSLTGTLVVVCLRLFRRGNYIKSGNKHIDTKKYHAVLTAVCSYSYLLHKYRFTGGLTKPRPWRGRCRAGYSNTGGPPLPRKRAPLQKKYRRILYIGIVQDGREVGKIGTF